MSRLLDTRRPRLLLALFCLLLWVPGLFTIPPSDRDESRFAQASKQMLETGDLVRIMNGTEPRNRKPIGIYWLQVPFAAAAHAAGMATGNPIWPYRLPSFIGALVAVLFTFSIGETLFDRRTGLLAAAALAACVLLAVEAHIAKTDAALAGATAAPMAVLARCYRDPGAVRRRDAALFWLAMGMSILLKGPVGPMVVALAVLALVAVDRRAACLRGLRPGWGVPLMLAVVLPWFVAIGVATGGRFFSDAVGGDLGRKLASGDDAHGGPPGLHLLLLPLLLFPATAALPGAAVLAWRNRAAPATRFLLAWIVPSWLVFEAVPTKLPHYTLPLYPAICVLAAAWMLAPGRPFRRLGAWLTAAVAVLLGAAAMAAPIGLHLDPLIALPAAAACLLLVVLAFRPPPAVLVAAPLLYWAVLQTELPRLAPLWLAPRIAAALPPGRLGTVGYAEPSLMFLAGTDTEFLRPDAGAQALADGEVTTLLVGDRDLAAIMADAGRLGLHPAMLATVSGFNYSRGRFLTLTLLGRPSRPTDGAP